MQASPRRRNRQLERILIELGYCREVLVKLRRSVLSFRRAIILLRMREADAEPAARLESFERELQSLAGAEEDLCGHRRFHAGRRSRLHRHPAEPYHQHHDHRRRAADAAGPGSQHLRHEFPADAGARMGLGLPLGAGPYGDLRASRCTLSCACAAGFNPASHGRVAGCRTPLNAGALDANVPRGSGGRMSARWGTGMLVAAALAAAPAHADAVARFYQGRQISLIVGYGPGRRLRRLCPPAGASSEQVHSRPSQPGRAEHAGRRQPASRQSSLQCRAQGRRHARRLLAQHAVHRDPRRQPENSLRPAQTYLDRRLLELRQRRLCADRAQGRTGEHDRGSAAAGPPGARARRQRRRRVRRTCRSSCATPSGCT